MEHRGELRAFLAVREAAADRERGLGQAREGLEPEQLQAPVRGPAPAARSPEKLNNVILHHSMVRYI